MSKVIIHYFTGTGNTAHAVKVISRELQTAGHEVKALQVKNGVLPPDETFDYHIVAFPVLSWAAPVMMKRYLRKMPSGKSVKTAILAVKGAAYFKGKLSMGYSGQALVQARNILTRKDYNVFLTGEAAFPDNWTQMTNPCDESDTKTILEVGEEDIYAPNRALPERST
jgi:menaquinone-dependent protoporphyrinogen IX oxidase